MRLTFEQEQAIDRAKERLVPAAEKLLKTARVVEINKNDLGESQLRNLVALANETESPAVVLNFIRYQRGRDNRGKAWNKVVADGKTVAELFQDEIEKGSVQKELGKMKDLTPTEMEEQLVKMALLRNFLGFTSRYMKFLDLKRTEQKRGDWS